MTLLRMSVFADGRIDHLIGTFAREGSLASMLGVSILLVHIAWGGEVVFLHLQFPLFRLPCCRFTGGGT